MISYLSQIFQNSFIYIWSEGKLKIFIMYKLKILKLILLPLFKIVFSMKLKWEKDWVFLWTLKSKFNLIKLVWIFYISIYANYIIQLSSTTNFQKKKKKSFFNYSKVANWPKPFHPFLLIIKRFMKTWSCGWLGNEIHKHLTCT